MGGYGQNHGYNSEQRQANDGKWYTWRVMDRTMATTPNSARRMMVNGIHGATSKTTMDLAQPRCGIMRVRHQVTMVTVSSAAKPETAGGIHGQNSKTFMGTKPQICGI